MLRDDPVGFLSGFVATAYAEAAQQEQVKGDCGYTPLEHFIIGDDGIARLQSNHIHANLITADRIYVPPKHVYRLDAGTI